MRIFVPAALVIVVFVLLLVYLPSVRTFMKAHWKRVLLSVIAVPAVLLLIFALLSVSTWRVF